MVRHLAVAHQTSESEEFIQALTQLTAGDPETEIVLVIPATPVKHLGTWTEGEARAVAAKKGAAARATLESAGVTVVETRVGDANPYRAVMDALVGEEFGAVIVSTFPPRISRWLGLDVVRRLERDIDLPVTHVIAH